MADAARRRFPLGFLLLVGISFPVAFLYFTVRISDSLPPDSALASPDVIIDDPQNPETDEKKLENILKKASMADNTVILTTVNEAWASPGSVLDLFLHSFRTGELTSPLLKHLVIISLDERAQERCNIRHPFCYYLKTEGIDFSEEKMFLTEDYLRMIWRRIEFLRGVLEMGFHFIFTDADVMWLRDPLPFFKADSDFQIACDVFNGDPTDKSNIVNGGFKHVKSNERTKLFYDYWLKSKLDFPGMHDQDVLNRIKFDPYIVDLGLTFTVLPTWSFGGICQPSVDFDRVCTMHANCCVGLVDKLNDLRVILQDWRFYRDRPGWKGEWRVPQMCRKP